MKAIVQTNYGSTDVLQLQEVAKPIPADNEVLIKVYNASVTPSDSAFRMGNPFIVRMMYGLQKPRQPIGGVEFSGVIEAIGKDVTLFQVGDAVMGLSPDHFGSYGEYLCLQADKAITLKPAQLPFDEAVAIVDGAATARTFLREVANVQAGQTVLINGASGAVGAYAVQIAKYLGAEVTGVCSSRNMELVKSLGADYVIDYTQTDFAKTGKTYDVIFDAVGKRSFDDSKDALTVQGIYMSTVPTMGLVTSLLKTMFGNGKKAKFTTAGLKQNKGTLDELIALYDAGAIRAVIDRYYSLAEIPVAHDYVDSGRKRGNVVINFVTQQSVETIDTHEAILVQA